MTGAGSAGAIAGRAADVPAGSFVRVRVGDELVCVVNCGGAGFHAVADTCSHAQASLSEGEVYADECQIECPLHGALFDLRTGAALTLPAVTPVRTYPVRIVDGEIQVGGV